MDSEVSTDSFEVCRGQDVHTRKWQQVTCVAVPTNYERFIRAIRTGKPCGGADFTRGEEIQRVLDGGFLSAAKDKIVKVS